VYNLVVSTQFQDWDGGGFRFEKGRFLEYTNDQIKMQIHSLSNDAIACIKSWPCILMQEGRSEEPVHIARISEFRDLGKEVGLRVELYQSNPQILNDHLWRARESLDIGQFEFSRNHWAIKEGDLVSILRSNGIEINCAEAELLVQKPLPAPSRASLMKARNAISELSHTKIDDLVLEAGLPDLEAGREIGSRRDRANLILQYAIDNPSAVTAENSLFSVFLVKQADSQQSVTEDISSISTHQDSATASQIPPSPASSDRTPNRVFVVHGQNNTARSKVVSFLESIGLKGVVLHEQPNMGRHLRTKFIDEADLVTFAIVLMTDDDVGGLKGSELRPRARQNVILKLGYFLSHLGQ